MVFHASSSSRASRYASLREGRQYTHARSHRSVSETRTVFGWIGAAVPTTGSERPRGDAGIMGVSP